MPPGTSAMQNFVRFLHEIRGYWRLLLIIGLLTLVNSALSLPPPKILQYLTDNLQQHHPVNLPGVFCVVVGLALGSAFFGYWLTYSITLLGQRFKYAMRHKLYAHMQTLSLGFFEKSLTGKLMSNITNDVASLDQLIGGGFVNVLNDSVTLIGAMVIIFVTNWHLALVALIVYPIYVANYLTFIRRIKLTSDEVREQRETIYGDLQEKLAGVQIVKSYAKERYEVRQFVGETRNLLGLNVRMTMLSTGLWTIAEFIGSGIGTGLLLWYGGRLVIEGSLTPGGLMAFYGYMGGYLYAPTVRLIQLNDQIARTNTALGRIFQTLDTKPLVNDRPNALALPTVRGDVRYQDVWFEYEPGQPVIKGVNLDVKAGQMVAFVGTSGSGKTTMINLLQRHYDVTEGSLMIDGHDLREVQLKSVRQQVGVVIQETVLFNTTIRENIRYGKLQATDEQVEDAARAANIHHVIEALPRGYDTRLGEQGIKLSGGEKQRIAIARAILSDPRILILDEATSSLDSETESLIQEALDRLMTGRTSFVVAHRLSTIVKADKIVVMSKGVIQEMGSHEELLAQDGIYAGLYNQQFKVALEGHAAPPLAITS
ncbi:MAG: ABC-type multidrug transport system, ATPase and permease component [Chthonomonadales bacterium]|nr:ABC-type multidrug transport system, ATPase and permease component [Chthonomonadales bacterium]